MESRDKSLFKFFLFFIINLKHNSLHLAPQSCVVWSHLQSCARCRPAAFLPSLFPLNLSDFINQNVKTFFSQGLCVPSWWHPRGAPNTSRGMLNAAGSSCQENMFHLANLIKAWCLPLLLVSFAIPCCPEETETFWNRSVCVILKLVAFAMATCYQG